MNSQSSCDRRSWSIPIAVAVALLLFGIARENIPLPKIQRAPTAITYATIASWYDSPRWGCASNDYPAGTLFEVTHAGRTILVPVLGKGPAQKYYDAGRHLDLTAPAFAALADKDLGLIPITLKPSANGP